MNDKQTAIGDKCWRTVAPTANPQTGIKTRVALSIENGRIVKREVVDCAATAAANIKKMTAKPHRRHGGEM